MPPKLRKLRIEVAGEPQAPNVVEQHWTRHTIANAYIASPRQSIAYIKEIDRLYPLFSEICGLYGDHAGETILDYGCGPGNELAGFFLYSNAKMIIGVDISMTALNLARFRLALHDATSERVRLIKKSESDPTVPLPDNSVDYLQTMGVLQVVSDPLSVLKELHRVLKPGKHALVMVYNHESIYLHLSVPYIRQIQEGDFPGMTAYEAFRAFADNAAPIALCYTPAEFIALSDKAGFKTEFLQASFALPELVDWKVHGQAAMADTRLSEEHRQFLRELVIDERGYPRYRGHWAGMNAVFKLHK